jgi:transposase-like protein
MPAFGLGDPGRLAPNFIRVDMNLSDKKLKITNLNRPSNSKKNYPIEKKIEAVTQYLALGNLKQVAAITGVSYPNIKLWKSQDWWKELEVEIKAARRLQTNSKLSKIVDKALATVEDRIENGDIVFNRKTNELERIPVSALTATKVANDLMQRQEALEKISVAEIQQDKTQTIQDQLKLLADEFAKFNTKRTINVQATEVIDAVYDERKEGLQEGERQVRLQALSSEEEGGEEQGESLDDEEGTSS